MSAAQSHRFYAANNSNKVLGLKCALSCSIKAIAYREKHVERHMAIFRGRCQVTRLGWDWVSHSLCDKTKGEISHALYHKIERVAVKELRSTYV